MRRVLQGVGLIVVLAGIVVGLLAWTQSGAPGAARCASETPQALVLWPGCAIAAHESLAAGLLGGAAALFGLWLVSSNLSRLRRTERERSRALARFAAEARLRQIGQEENALARYSERLDTILNDLEHNQSNAPKWPKAATLDRLGSQGMLDPLQVIAFDPVVTTTINMLHMLRTSATSIHRNMVYQQSQSAGLQQQSAVELNLYDAVEIDRFVQELIELRANVKAAAERWAEERKAAERELSLAA